MIENYFFKLGTQELFEIYITLESISIRSQFDAFLCERERLPRRCCSTLSAGLASCWRSCRLGSVQGCCQPGGSAMLSVRRPVGDAFGPALRWRRCRPSVVLATQSGRRHHVMVMVMLSARRLTTLSRQSLGDAVCQESCWWPLAILCESVWHIGQESCCRPGVVSVGLG